MTGNCRQILSTGQNGTGYRPLALDAAHITSADGPFPNLSLRTWRSLDSAGKVPRGHFVGGRKLWRTSDLQLWTAWAFPDRTEFEQRLHAMEGPA